MQDLQPINQAATAVFKTLIEGLNEPGDLKTLDKHGYLPERNGGIMSVHVECIGKNQYSVAHYFEQNGDLMSDPRMTFWVGNGKVYPCSFTQHSLGIYQVSVHFDDNEHPISVRRGQQQEHVGFVNYWMNNIKDQQDI